MREFSLKDRFSFRSLNEITEPIGVAHLKIKGRRDGIEGRLSREIMLNSILIHFANLPLEDQLAVFDSGLARLAPLLATADGPGVDASSTPEQIPVDVEDVTPAPAPAKPSRRKRSG